LSIRSWELRLLKPSVLIATDNWLREKGSRPPYPKLEDPLATMPPQEPQRASEAVRRILPDLIKLDRCERRAAARRDRAIRQITKSAPSNDGD
jgi:hypothetical protein